MMSPEKRNTALVFLLGILSTYLTYAQNSNEEYKFIEVQDIPVRRAVTAFAQDANGFLWFGTYGAGLYKYDGNNFSIYKDTWKKKNSLSSSLVHAVFVDASGTIWVGTEKGLNKYRFETDDFEQIDLFSGSNGFTLPVHSIGSLDKNTLLLGSHGNGAYTVTISSGAFRQIPFKSDVNYDWIRFNSITTLNATTYLGTSLGLYHYDASENKIVRSRFITKDSIAEVHTHIHKLFPGLNQNLWIGTYNEGLVRLNFENEYPKIHKFPISDKRILSITQLKDGKLFVGSENDGLFILDENGNQQDNYTNQKFGDNLIQANSLWSLFVDNEERIWIGYYSNGISFYDKNYDKFKDIESVPFKEESLQYGSVTGILEDDDTNLWISMDGGGIDIYNPRTKHYTHLLDQNNPVAKGLLSSDIQSIFFDSQNNLWASSWNTGIYFLKDGSDTFINYTQKDGLASRSTICFAEDAQGIIYIGTFNAGLQTYNPKTATFTHLNDKSFRDAGIANCDVRKILIDSNQVIWVGTTKGLFTVRKKSGKYSVQSQNEKMYENRKAEEVQYYILSLYEDPEGTIWIGTDGGGLCKYDKKSQTFEWLQERIKKQTVASIIGDSEGKIWIAGNDGISKYNPSDKSVTNYTQNDGLLANDFHNNAVLKTRDNLLYFGNYSGINYFDPSALNSNVKQPDLYFSGLRLFNEEVVPKEKDSPLNKALFLTDALTLTHKQSVFTIEYASIDYTRPADNNYAYILEGFDNSWNYVGSTKNATYTNLPAGIYNFKVKASNNDGVWTEEPIMLKIRILNPWWKQLWAISLYIALLVFLLFLSYRFTQKRLEEKRLIKYERDKRQQEEELNNRKLQFFTNISHEFRTPLTLIKNPIEDLIHTTDYKFPKTIVDKHKSIYRNTERLIRLINELMDFRKLQFNKTSIKVEKINITRFCELIVAHFKEEAYQRNIALEVFTEETELCVYADAGMLEKVIFNLLSNAFKATPDNGLVSVSILSPAQKIMLPEISNEVAVDAIEIKVEDTGFGIPERELNKIFDPFYQVEGMNKQYYGGTGIGLEVVRNFLLMNKGKIEVTSTLYKGTTFTIYLALGKGHFKKSEFLNEFEGQAPLDQAVDLVPHPQAASKAAPEKKPDDKRETLLIVEDNFELRKYLKDQLKSTYRILEALNGKQGLEMALDTMPDLIITDVLMPQMDGVEFCKRIKADLKTSHIPIMMLTAKAQTDDWLDGLNAGADVYINKPFDIKVIKSQLKRFVDSKQILFNKYFEEVNKSNIKSQTTSIDKNFIVKVIKYIHLHIDDTKLNVENLAEELSLSRSQLYRKIKALTGQTANEFIRKIRLQKAKELLENGEESVSEVGYKVGFSSPSYFTKCFKNEFGQLPTEIRNE
ncbi:hybrid sensor histidine kinase/response regulator transcription factor [Leeuwenhoekiella marinoflava]|uniref:histidine kinase n=2 Tax=Leeuwenhoekiella marinoflava TaxID=988 RepID=A0A4Q0PP87_9FLAO|nr:hybrid sensor histidine kinase/response regulator transcription factor [Leeuwenhoekiella marinoflava]RXG32399.1 signal transduction histidine kinase [Leeuwenhoekiella marinoflava]SHE73139.1 Signal transduction histidine kinase [Leeuwenhoekiella marinoflava DSM 3653]